MKLVVIVPDGLCDHRYPALDNRSPVEYAHTPGMDTLVRQGRVGLARTMMEGLPLGSLVGLLGLLGYDPRDHFPLSRAIFEAYALGLILHPADLVFRCNIVRVGSDNRLLDFTAGQIDEVAAQEYLASLSLPPPFEIHHDLSYRNVLIYRHCPLREADLQLYAPHDHTGRTIRELLPRYRNRTFSLLADLMTASRREGLMLWPWGPGRSRPFPPLPYRLGLVTALSFLAGMGKLLGGQVHKPPGATGYLGSNLEAKRLALLACLPEVDVALIHCNAPDEEAHIHNLQGKVQALEDIDRQVVSPLLAELAGQGEPYRLLLCPDHYTCCGDGRHHAWPVPYAAAGPGLTPNHPLTAYSEAAIAAQVREVTHSYTLVPGLLHGPEFRK